MTEKTDPRAQRRMGRPYRAPTDLTAASASVPEQRPRLAWLLGINRMLRLDGAYAHRRDFLAALADEGVSCDESKLSRWESGASSVPPDAIRAYEEILDLDPHSLRAAIALEIDPEPQRRKHQKSAAEFDRLISAILAGNATAPEWMELTDELASDREVYLRASDWAQLTSQLLSEQARATGTAYVARTVAATRLAAHPAAQPHFVRSVGALVLDDRVRRREGAVRLLASLQGPRAWNLMLRLCTTGALPVRMGAIDVAIRHAGDEPRTRQELATLEKALVQLLEELPGDRSLLALAEQLPEASAQFRAHLANLGTAEPILVSTAERSIAAGLAAAAQAALHGQHGGWDGEPDAMLVSLTADALFHPTARRIRAAYGVLDASPYRLGLANAALDLAGRNLKTNDPAGRAAARMAHFLQAEDGAKLLHIAESARDTRRRAEITAALAGQRDPLSRADLARVSALQDSPEMVDATVHALGMLGMLDTLRPTGTKKLDERAQRMATWWRSNGARVEA
ncbi:MAG: hypothetical protein ACXVD1_08635 [Nocardioides sp.]